MNCFRKRIDYGLLYQGRKEKTKINTVYVIYNYNIICKYNIIYIIICVNITYIYNNINIMYIIYTYTCTYHNCTSPINMLSRPAWKKQFYETNCDISVDYKKFDLKQRANIVHGCECKQDLMYARPTNYKNASPPLQEQYVKLVHGRPEYQQTTVQKVTAMITYYNTVSPRVAPISCWQPHDKTGTNPCSNELKSLANDAVYKNTQRKNTHCHLCQGQLRFHRALFSPSSHHLLYCLSFL